MLSSAVRTARIAPTSVYRIAPLRSISTFPSRRLRPSISVSSTRAAPQLARMFATSRLTRHQPKTYSLQPTIPRLPVPDLEKSLEGYLKSLVPVIEQKYGPSGLKKELEKRRLFIRDFAAPGGLGRVLQQRLLDLDHISPNSWLNDTLWLGPAYHSWRAPLLINSNWWLLFAPDPADPEPPVYRSEVGRDMSLNEITPNPSPTAVVAEGSQKGGKEWLDANPTPERPAVYEDVVQREWVTGWQVRRASWIARRFAEFRERLAKEEIAPDSSKAGPFCMEQYRHLFNFSRIPLPGCDAFSTPAPTATHLTLLIDDFIYSIDVFAPVSSALEIPTPLPVAVIEKRIKGAVDDARSRVDAGEKAKAVGILTADERDTWTKNRERLLLLSPNNRTSLNALSTSLFALSLDTYTLPSLPSSDPLRHAPLDAQIRNVSAGLNGGSNRWFDKPISIPVETNGRAGILGEHSPVDALIPSIAIEYVLAEPVDNKEFEKGSVEESGNAGERGWSRVEWVLDEAMESEIEECRGRNRGIVSDSEGSQLWWNEYGVEWIKRNAKLSPDAYIQQALQLAWFRDQGYATATYETASTRAMLHGRTDVIRSLSTESREFVKAMVDDKSDDSTRYALLSTATQAHALLTKTSSAGHGFDRHLMGLRTRLRPGETHALFEDECYAKSQEWKLSTSGLSAGGKFMGTGFGAGWADGYGINYLAGPYLVKFGIEGKYSSPATSVARFKHQIVQALRDMRRVCEAAAAGSQAGASGKGGAGSVKAKL